VCTLIAQACDEGQFPKEDPHWDPNDDQDYQHLEQYQETLLGGMKEGQKKAMNLSKMQKSSKSQMRAPASCIIGYVKLSAYTLPIDPEAAENQRMIYAAYVSQAQGDRRKKL
jgi:hypothetical protein